MVRCSTTQHGVEKQGQRGRRVDVTTPRLQPHISELIVNDTTFGAILGDVPAILAPSPVPISHSSARKLSTDICEIPDDS